MKRILKKKKFINKFFLKTLPIALCLASPLVLAEEPEKDLFDLNMEDLPNLQVQSVYAASKYEQSTLRAPASVSIVTSEDIRRYGWRNLGEILESVRGFHVGFDRSFHSAGVRGILKDDDYNDNGILVLVDGVRINDDILGASSISRDFPVDIDLIEKLEIVRGPGSVLYGSNAFLAVINVITRKADDIKGTELLGSIGSKEEYRRRLTVGHTFDSGWGFTGSGTFFNRQGEKHIYTPEFDDPSTNNGVADNLDDDKLGNGYFELSKGKFILQGLHSDREKLFSEAPYEGLFNSPQGVRHQRTMLNVQYSHEFANDWDLQVKSSYNKFYELGRYIYDTSEESDGSYFVDADEKFRSQHISGEALVSKKLNKKYTVTFGSEYRYNFQQDISSNENDIYYLAPDADIPELNEILNVHEKSNEVGLFTQVETELSNKLFLTTGVRYDYYDLVSSNDSINPRVALVYQPKESTALKFNYGSAFRAPSGFEYLFNDGNVFQKSPTSLNPEKIDTYETVVEHYFDKNFSATATAYYSKLKDPISLTEDPADGVSVFKNDSKEIAAHGVEFGLERNWEKGWKSRVSYAYQDNKDEATDKILANSPQNLFKLNTVAPLIPENLFLGYELQYTGSRYAVSGTEADQFFVSNVTLSSDDVIVKNLRAQLSSYNVFNQAIYNPGSNYQTQDFIRNEGRTYIFELMYKF